MSKLWKALLLVLLVVSITGCQSDTDKEENEVTDTTEMTQVAKGDQIAVVSAIASTDDGNIAENTIDTYGDTRWSGEGEDASVIYDFGAEQTVEKVAIAFYKGDIRYTNFDLEVSSDGETWENVYSGNNKEEPTLELVTYDLEGVTARYVKFIGHGYEHLDGSKTGLWNSIVEVQFFRVDDAEVVVLGTSEVPVEVSYTLPGFINPDGSDHPIHTPHAVSGETITVDTFTGEAIQAAIDGANAGDEVFLPAGTYEVASTILLKAEVNLRGESGTIIQATKDSGEYPTVVLDVRGLNNVLISDLTVTSTFDGDFTIDHKNNNPDADGPKYMIRIEDSSSNKPSYNITVESVLIEKYQTMGIRVVNSHDVVIRKATFQNATDLGGGGAGYGISIQGDGNNMNRIGYTNDSRFTLVEDCDFVGPYLRHGIIVQYYSHNNLITNNRFTATKLDAIDLHGEDEYLNEVSYNVVKDIETGAAIGVGNSGASHDAAGPGNYIHHNEIINAREGIKVHLGSPDTLIEYNVIKDFEVVNSKGIYIQNAPGTIIRNNEISNCNAINFWAISIDGDSGTEGRGEGIATNVTIEDNMFSGLPGGLKITRAKDLFVHNNTYDMVDVEVLDTREYNYEVDLLPSQVLSLTNWKINLPIENAKEIRQPDLKTFEDERFFYTTEENDGVVFNAPCQADETDATTANSKYPRSELREMAFGGRAEASWETDNGTHVMIIDEAIMSTPEAKPHVVVGQIHDADDDVVMIRLEGSRLFVEAEGVDVGVLDEDYVLGTRFIVEIEAKNDVIEVSYNGDTMVTYEVHKVGCYFKAGMYTQSNVSKGDAPDAYGEVIIYNLKVTHSDVAQKYVQDFENPEIPAEAPDATLVNVQDTYIDLMKVDGVLTANVSPRVDDDKLMIKTSSGQTTIRLAFMTFDISGLSANPSAATLNVVGKDINGSNEISVYGFEQGFDSTLTWGDLFTIDSQISKKNSEVMDYLNHFGSKTGTHTIESKDPTKAVEDKDMYSINVSDFVSKASSDLITLVIVEEVGVNVNLQLHSMESNPEYAPTLNIWAKAGESISVEEQPVKEEETPTEEVVEEEVSTGINLNVVDVDEALQLLNYTSIEQVDGQLILPVSIGKEVSISWVSDNPAVVSDLGEISKPSVSTDVTMTAILTKGEEITEKPFIVVISAD